MNSIGAKERSKKFRDIEEGREKWNEEMEVNESGEKWWKVEKSEGKCRKMGESRGKRQ